MSVSYVKPSMDAAIAGTYKDLKVKNPYDTPIYVEGYTKEDPDLYDLRKRDETVEQVSAFESETLLTTPSPTQEIQDPESS